MLPSPDILNEFEHGRFVLSNLAAKRAKQIKEGAPPLVRVDSHHPLTIALAEIAAGKIKPILQDVGVFEDEEVGLLIDETRPPEFGVLLPALDDAEASLVADVVLAPDDHEPGVPIEETLSLTDLHVEEDEEVVPAAGEEQTLSLTDIAEEESSVDEPETEG